MLALHFQEFVVVAHHVLGLLDVLHVLGRCLLLVPLVVVLEHLSLVVVVALPFVLLLLRAHVVHLLVKFGPGWRVKGKPGVL